MRKYPQGYLKFAFTGQKFLLCVYGFLIIFTVINGSSLWWKIFFVPMLLAILSFNGWMQIMMEKRREEFERGTNVKSLQL